MSFGGNRAQLVLVIAPASAEGANFRGYLDKGCRPEWQQDELAVQRLNAARGSFCALTESDALLAPRLVQQLVELPDGGSHLLYCKGGLGQSLFTPEVVWKQGFRGQRACRQAQTLPDGRRVILAPAK